MAVTAHARALRISQEGPWPQWGRAKEHFQRLLSGLGVKLLQIDGRGFLFRRVAKDPDRPFPELVWMNITLLRMLGEVCSPRTAARATFALTAGP